MSITHLLVAGVSAKLSGARRYNGFCFLLASWLLVFTFSARCNAARRRVDGELLSAVSRGNPSEATVLLRDGANPNEHDQERWSPLMAAATRGDEELTAVLLKAGAQVDWRNDLKRTPLMLAAWRGHLNVMRRLLEAGANLNARSKGLWSPLMYAVDGQHAAAAKLLLSRGGDARVEGLGYTSAMRSACELGGIEIIEALANAGANVNAKVRGGGSTMLGVAASEGRVEAVEVLLRLGAEVSPAMAPYDTPLHNAIQRRSTYDDPNTPRVIALLLKAGARPSQEDLSVALYVEQIDTRHPITDLLLQAGVSLSAKDSTGWTALHKAVLKSSVALVELLLEHGAEIDALDRSSMPAIAYAAYSGRADIVDLLIRHGARLELQGPSNNQASPLASAAAAGHSAIVRTLVAAGAKTSGVDAARALFFAARKLDAATVDALLEAGANPNFAENGWTPLAIALGDPQPGDNMLVEGKPDPERMRAPTELITRRFLAVPSFSQIAKTNAFLHASSRQPVVILRLLLEAGADPDGREKNYGTARENALRNPDPQVKAFLQTLK